MTDDHLQLVIAAHHMVYAAAAIFVVWAVIAFRWEIISWFMQSVCENHYQPYDEGDESKN